MAETGITIPRDGYRIVLLDAIPVSVDEQRAIEQLLDTLGAPKRPEPRKDNEP